MPRSVKISFSRSAKSQSGLAVFLQPEKGAVATSSTALDPQNVLEKAARVAKFSGKQFGTLDVIAPAESPADRLVVVGLGDVSKLEASTWMRLGGVVCAGFAKATEVTVYLEDQDIEITAENAADLAAGMLLRNHRFDKYKTKKSENGENDQNDDVVVTIVTADPSAAKKAFANAEAVAEGVMLARDLVNEPANILGPVEFAAKAKELEQLGVEVEILTEKEMKKLGMGALLGVAQGSSRPPRLAIMNWKGGKSKEKPVAFVGKGVVFDSGGISIKPAGGMEDMKGDMGGAAAVTGLMHALAARKAKANVVGIIGLVENMLDGNAQRPGDIVTSMSGQTIEVLNTDAEGRLVLADAIWYTIDRFKPRFVIDLATLTGAIMVALGSQHAGLFSNDDELATQLSEAGTATGEKVWRMPLGAEYDKLIDSKNADMKNIGGRYAGAITAAQFLKRFVKDTNWAHLDVAGTAMGSPATEISQGWASGYGVRLLDRLVADHYEG
jgi:leucyl aminopeptidase